MEDVDEFPKVPSDLMLNEREVVRSTGKESIKTFLQRHSLYNAIRDSGKVVVFDTNIPIQLAFYALLEHDLPAAPLWDSQLRNFIGLLSVTDFIDILRHYHRRGIAMDELSARSIAEVIADGKQHGGRPLQHSKFNGTLVDVSILDACRVLQQQSHRFLPVIPPDDTRVLSILSHHDVLQFLVVHFREERRLFEDSVLDLGIGTFGQQVVTVSRHGRLAEVLDLMENKDISAVPVVDDDGKVTHLYNRSDITFLATATDAESVIANLDLTIGQLIDQRQEQGPDGTASADGQAVVGGSGRDRLHTCSTHTSLQALFELFAEVGFHLVVCIDEEGRCTGVISVRDLVAYFLS